MFAEYDVIRPCTFEANLAFSKFFSGFSGFCRSLDVGNIVTFYIFEADRYGLDGRSSSDPPVLGTT